MHNHANQALQLRLLRRLQSESQPLAECARALQAFLRTEQQVRAVWYFSWLDSVGIYTPEGDVRGWPPGPDDRRTATDRKLFALLQKQSQFSIEQILALNCWLSKRIRRAGLQHGVVVSMPLSPEQDGLVVIELKGDAPLFALDGLLSMLTEWLRDRKSVV